ncbi:hypothetical protein OSB04_030995 [Centaurea solstitialis]|uniref:Uncharacterized protein n=1 Tax=Centaurea solstitialis TaxID=347529 RepID=A0AA38VX70_9ASTR|nr:hypothetical protein OSB04_030995 [Centaurea solstitialis]
MAKEHSRFTEPEMEAALQLIQLSGESDVDLHGFSLSSAEALATTNTIKKTIRRGKEDHDESQGSSTSDITSAPPRRFVARRFEAEDEDDDAAGSNWRRKRKKFRSVSEIYKISMRLLTEKIIGMDLKEENFKMKPKIFLDLRTKFRYAYPPGTIGRDNHVTKWETKEDMCHKIHNIKR